MPCFVSSLATARLFWVGAVVPTCSVTLNLLLTQVDLDYTLCGCIRFSLAVFWNLTVMELTELNLEEGGVGELAMGLSHAQDLRKLTIREVGPCFSFHKITSMHAQHGGHLHFFFQVPSNVSHMT